MLIVISVLLVAVMLIVIYTLKNGISPMPSTAHARLTVQEQIKKLTSNSNHIIIDVGSGWGTLAFQVSRNFPNHTVIGLENSLIPLWISRLFKMKGPYSNLSLFHQNIYTYSYTQADIILCYLYPGAMNRLSKIFEQQTQQDVYIISVYFALPGWKPMRIIECKDIHRTKVYVYNTQKC